MFYVMHYIFCQIIFLDIVILDVISTHSGALRPGSMFYAFPPIDWDYTFRPDPIEGLTKAPHALTVASDPSLKLKSISIADCKIRSSQPGKYITNICICSEWTNVFVFCQPNNLALFNNLQRSVYICEVLLIYTHWFRVAKSV